MKAKILLLSALIFLPALASASVDITYVEYDLPGSDAGREWIEITNNGSESVDISKYRFREGGVNHKLTLVSGTSTLVAGASAYIAEDPATFASEHPGTTEAIFKSSFSLSNSGETLALVDASSSVVATYTYTAAPKPAPVPKAPTAKSSSSKTSSKSSSVATSPANASYTYSDPSSVAAATAMVIPATWLWLAGLGGIIVLGVAGVVYARMQNRSNGVETREPGAEFQIIES
ncbi:MAG TPA: lamin tail domain-containing protein [Candidatus Paceibacterota bacterium]|nr:lamin tail domain-containing protein [Candidatus Paceibacterota bacterium]